MASPPYQYNHPPHHGQAMPSLQTQNINHHPSQQPFSPQHQYHQSPQGMSPTYNLHTTQPPAKRQRLSPDPRSPAPYQTPYGSSPYGGQSSPHGAASPGGGYPSLPGSPAPFSPPAFSQPQPYPQAAQSSMPPPKVPASKTQDTGELEKANPRDMDVNNISDVLTGSGIDIRAEEENLLHTFRTQPYNSFNSQASGSTVSPHGSFGNWQGASASGAFQGSGALSQPMTKEQQEAELIQKHAVAARAYNEVAAAPLTDPFLHATLIRQRVTTRAYEYGLKLNLEGLFDKIPDTPNNVTRTVINSSEGDETISALQADSLLNQNAPFVDILSLVSLAAEERIRTLIDDSYTFTQNRQQNSHGVVTPDFADIALVNGETRPTTAVVTNISKTAWEAAPDSAISPMTVTANKHPNNAARLPTPPTDASPTPQPTIIAPNLLADALTSMVDRQFKLEEARLARRKKRQQGEAAAAPPEPAPIVLPTPTQMTKKEANRLAKAGQTDEVLHRKANETASMALGFGKKKYSWMTGGGGGGGASGASTPRLNTAVGSVSGTSTPAQAPVDQALQGTKRKFGDHIESGDLGRKIQVRDVLHALNDNGYERKTYSSILAKLKSSDRDDGIPTNSSSAPTAS